MVDWGCAPQPEYEALRQSKAAVLKAIELDPNLGAAHAWLGMHAFYYEWDWPKAEAELKQAIELDPNDSGAHVAYGHVSRGHGQAGAGPCRNEEGA